MAEFILHKGDEGGWLRVLANAISFLQGLARNKSWKLTIVEYRKARSNDANAYYWTVVLPTIVRELGHTQDDWHEMFCGEYFGWRRIEIGGRAINRPMRRTTEDEKGRKDVLDTARFWQFVEFAIRQAGAAGVYIPGPNEAAA